MFSGTKNLLVFCYIFKKHEYFDATVLILCIATVSVDIYLICLEAFTVQLMKMLAFWL